MALCIQWVFNILESVPVQITELAQLLKVMEVQYSVICFHPRILPVNHLYKGGYSIAIKWFIFEELLFTTRFFSVQRYRSRSLHHGHMILLSTVDCCYS